MAPEARTGEGLKRRSPGIAGQGFGNVNQSGKNVMNDASTLNTVGKGAELGTVEFLGKPLTVITTDSQLLVAMRPICEGIGLDWKSQYERIKRDEVLSTSVVVMTTVAQDGKQRETTCLPLSMLNGWLFGVDAKRCKPFIRQALVRYKFECYDALAAYWQQCSATALPSPAALPAPEEAERITHAFRGSRVEFLVDGRQVWVKASCITTALGLGSSDRITRSLADDRKVYRMRGQQKHWFIDPAAALRAAGYVRESEKAKAWDEWLTGVLKTFDNGVQKAALVEALVPGHTPVERYGLEQLLDTKMLFSLDEQGRAQVKPIPPGAMIVTPARLADVLRDPYTVPVEYLPNLMQVIAGRMGAVLQNTLPSR